MSADDREIESDGTRVTVQRRERPSYADQEALFVSVYDRTDEFGKDYSQYQFLIIEEDDRRAVRFMQQKGITRPPQEAVDAVHEAGFEIEGYDDIETANALSHAHDIIVNNAPDFEEFPVTYNLLSDAASHIAWVSQTQKQVFNNGGPENRFLAANVETERDLFEFLSRPTEAQMFWDRLGDNPMATAMMRAEVLAQYDFDFLESVEDAPDSLAVVDDDEENDG